MEQDTSAGNMTPEQAHTILGLRLLIARAANMDSLAWWEDESLASHAGVLLERLFPRAPLLAARNLALHAAMARHQAACAQYEGALHLYRLDVDNKDKLALRFESPLPITVPEAPILTMDNLRALLLDRTQVPCPYTVQRRTESHGLQIVIPPPPPDMSPLVHRAGTLAWAYLEASPQEPVFPFCYGS